VVAMRMINFPGIGIYGHIYFRFFLVTKTVLVFVRETWRD
jgi:hypothetical protein